MEHVDDIILDYEKERETIIEDGSLAILSVFPIDLRWNDKIKNDEIINYKNAIIEHCTHSVNNESFSFLQKRPDCPEKCKEKELTNCSCFDVIDSFVGDNDAEKKHTANIRLHIGTTYCIWQNKRIRIDIFTKLLYKENVGVICFNLSLNGLSAEQAIALKHKVSGRELKDEENLSDFLSPSPTGDINISLTTNVLSSLFNKLSDALKKDTQKISKRATTVDPLAEDIILNKSRFCCYTIVELRKIGNFSTGIHSARKWAKIHVQLIYGLLTGDEGIGFIPEKMAMKRIENHWGSRDFCDIIAIGHNALMLNSKSTSDNGKRYMEFQKKWNKDYCGGVKRIQYFTGKPCIAGYDHGVLNAVERNIIIGYYYDFIDNQEQNLLEGSTANLNNTNSGNTNRQRLNRQRRQLISFINSSLSSIHELDVMYEIITKASGIDRNIENVRYKLNIRSEEMGINYQNTNNTIIRVLTVLSLTVAILAFLDISISRKPIGYLFMAILIIIFFIGTVSYIELKRQNWKDWKITKKIRRLINNIIRIVRGWFKCLISNK